MKNGAWEMKAARRVIDNLSDRSGFEFGDIDRETMREIVRDLAKVIYESHQEAQKK